MEFKAFGVSVKISFLLIAMLTLFSLYDKTQISLCAVFCAISHELGHIISALLLKCQIKELAFMPFGIRMCLSKPLTLMPTLTRFIVLASGVTVNALCFTVSFLLLRGFSTFSIVHFAIGIFNLLPVRELDGGKLLELCLLHWYNEEKTENICNVISYLTAAIIMILGALVLAVTGYNFSLLITAIYLFVMLIIRQKRLNL